MIVAGFGFTSQATSDSLLSALAKTGMAADITLLATPADKATQAPIRALATDHLPIKPITPERLEKAQTQTQSPISQAARRTGSVAEAAALAAAGPQGTLVVTRQISDDRMATCAIAKGPDT
ncbi:MAG: cobalamin biosynthesis protein [Pseudomonadota bacterium]